MAGKRPRKAKLVRKKPWLLDQPSTPEQPEPLMLSCTSCDRKVEQTAHSCPDCGTVFYQRPGTRRAINSSGVPRQPDAEAIEFSDRMDKAEMWTRIICILVGVLSALAFVGMLSWGTVRGSFLFFIIALVCLARGIYAKDKDLHVIEQLGGWAFGSWRLRR